MSPKKGFSDSLFDFSFSHFVTINIVGIVYAIALICSVFVIVAFIVSGFTHDILSGPIALIFSPLFGILYLLLVRISLEAIIAVIKTAQNTSQIAEDFKHLTSKN